MEEGGDRGVRRSYIRNRARDEGVGEVREWGGVRRSYIINSTRSSGSADLYQGRGKVSPVLLHDVHLRLRLQEVRRVIVHVAYPDLHSHTGPLLARLRLDQ